MKKHLLLPIVILLLLSLFQACTDQDQAIEPEQPIVEVVLLTEDNRLQNLVGKINQQGSMNGRSNSILDEVNFERAMKRFNPETGNTHYSFSMHSDSGLTLRKFILSENSENEISGHVFEYEVDADWLAEIEIFPGWHQYNGYFRILDLDEEVIAENEIVAGSSVSKESSNGRSSGYTCITTIRLIGWVGAHPDYMGARYETITTCFSSRGGNQGNETSQGDSENIGVEMGPTDIPIDGNGGGGGSSPTSCRDGYVRDGSGNCIATVVVISPETPIADMVKYLECFDTSKSATIAIYADQPKSGSSDAWAATWSGAVVGHTFVSIIQEANTSVFGFYPSTDDTRVTSPPELSAMGNDSGESYNVSVSITVSGNVLQQILQYAISYNDTYDLDNYNCTDFGIEIGNLAGMGLPDCYESWPGGGGSNPGTLGQHLRNMTLPNGAIRNTSGGTAPTNKKEC